MSRPQNSAWRKKCSKDVYNGTIPSLSRRVAGPSFFIAHYAYSFYILVDAPLVRRTKRHHWFLPAGIPRGIGKFPYSKRHTGV
jgi:hypothetical protein